MGINHTLMMKTWKTFIQQEGQEMNQLQEKITQIMTDITMMTNQVYSKKTLVIKL